MTNLERWQMILEDVPDEEYQSCLSRIFYPTIVFDVDSCIGPEGIDELGRIHHKTEEIAGMTRSAMGGDLSYDDVFAKRLDLTQPRESDLQTVADNYLRHMIKDTLEVFQALRAIGMDIHLLSGGFDAAIYPLAQYLGVPKNNMHANTLIFDAIGNYQGFDRQNPLSRQGGKKTVLEALLAEKRIYKPLAIVGDSITELETAPVTDIRIGFGGFVQRQRVIEETDVFLTQPAFAPLVPLVLDNLHIKEILDYHPKHRPILQKGLALIPSIRFNNRALKLQESLQITSDQIPVSAFDPKAPIFPIWNGY